MAPSLVGNGQSSPRLQALTCGKNVTGKRSSLSLSWWQTGTLLGHPCGAQRKQKKTTTVQLLCLRRFFLPGRLLSFPPPSNMPLSRVSRLTKGAATRSNRPLPGRPLDLTQGRLFTSASLQFSRRLRPLYAALSQKRYRKTAMQHTQTCRACNRNSGTYRKILVWYLKPVIDY